ncbi:aspartate ammonia-lyase [Myroides odoratimimus]|uniref:Aspartate ammonia-lyase n=1 Tax=Myroides odoratimimus CIP 101113 TaxID=883154 RepID=A0AAV3EZ57_9FLAO|nr:MULTISPECIES: aspartate ammonia-lyase [Myroides]EHO05188.1 aspartate ammonia-lyase [Myroides odoratimimus CCUG 12901]EHO05959.1 aspartate ammonia-lyase [Myroides odoratimimus CIP 101113]MCO7722051.1 aspartate ammonia-lyase [Myroides odoratimimus]MCS7472458.1 aspartate ammonia-lyase [Myroides odoratimimus]MDM1057793.1 aspartate ammonia-lyase [Myroides odoratimimus]
MKPTRIESDLIGELEIPQQAYYGVQTQRAINNFKISTSKLSDYPEFVKGLAIVKWAAAKTNFELNVLDEKIYKVIADVCQEIIDGKLHAEFPVDMIQGGAGTSVNMNANEVIANRALEILGFEKGDYQHCSPNDHVNLSQSTNDAYPTSLKVAVFEMNKKVVEKLEKLVKGLEAKAVEFENIIKMGRTQLQDAVPMTLGQEFGGFAFTLKREIAVLNQASQAFLEINMGATAIGTGLNAVPGYADLCAKNLGMLMKQPVTSAENLVEATSDTSGFVAYSGILKKVAIKLSKICNDLRLLSSGPRTGLNEIQLPPMQPGSSIMPGKVNPVIPEVVNQVCFKVIGNDMTITMASEAAQLQLNVMEPVLAHTLMESMTWLENAMETLVEKCVVGIKANVEHNKELVLGSIGIVTALNPYIGYKASTKIAKEALESGRGVYELVLEHNLLTKEKLDEILDPKHMLAPHSI